MNCLVSNTAAIHNNEISIFGLVGFLHSRFSEQILHSLSVGNVHLAAKSFDQKFLFHSGIDAKTTTTLSTQAPALRGALPLS
jgi:hypothetical protein